MRSDFWSLENEWLNDFAEVLVRGTHRRVRGIAIEGDADCLIVRGSARSYYAVQLAIHCVQSFNRKRSWFSTTRLLINVNGNRLDLRLTHRARRAEVAKASKQTNSHATELIYA